MNHTDVKKSVYWFKLLIIIFFFFRSWPDCQNISSVRHSHRRDLAWSHPVARLRAVQVFSADTTRKYNNCPILVRISFDVVNLYRCLYFKSQANFELITLKAWYSSWVFLVVFRRAYFRLPVVTSSSWCKVCWVWTHASAAPAPRRWRWNISGTNLRRVSDSSSLYLPRYGRSSVWHPARLRFKSERNESLLRVLKWAAWLNA